MEILLFGLLAVLVVFMFFNTRKRQKQMKAEQEEKATKTVPGVKVLLQGGIFGTIVAYDHEDLDSPALVEIAPGTVIEVHSQAILRIVEPKDVVVDDAADAVDGELEADQALAADKASETDAGASIETAEETRARLERDADDK
ncbi:preprotein translocase subunit YajC [Microbacterium sp. SD291]|uniref:preprotein translocase subunit YajC n=1 Tax=Microbacterium sp. SD291 TaxID=2782007 RepID=UPI001A95918D|nr:preprotein translocase subunit YajC [Microbacterium sp. SD291]MBO0979085.1 preprotein translocase subunit YajC [Microbacterium sp. SD291]